MYALSKEFTIQARPVSVADWFFYDQGVEVTRGVWIVGDTKGIKNSSTYLDDGEHRCKLEQYNN